MSLTTLLSNIPNLVKVLGLSAAVGTGGALAMQDAPSPADMAPAVSAERGPDHATGLERARSKANDHAAQGLSRAQAAKAAAAQRRAERGERGHGRAERGERLRGQERTASAGDEARGRTRAESRSDEARGRAIAESRGDDARGRDRADGERGGRDMSERRGGGRPF